MSKWEMVRLGDVLNYEQPTKYIVSTDKYGTKYSIPVLTAGKTFILGYTDEKENIFTNVPVIIFDDFTTAIKYVDFPFKVKSSAMKILNPTEKIDIKYTFYLMTTIQVDTGLHKRYWISKYADLQIPLPPLEVQKNIANELDAISALIAKRKEQIEKLDVLVKAKFVEMFETDYAEVFLNDVCIKITDGTHQSPKFLNEGIPFLLVSNIVNYSINYETKKYISLEEYEKLISRTPVEIGDILLTTVGSYGNPAVVETEKKFCFQRHIGYIKPKKEIINSYYLKYYFLSSHGKEQIEFKVKGIAQKTLNISELKTMKIILPPINLQNDFADYVEKVEKTKDGMAKGLEKLELLYKERMQEYFG